MCSFAVGADTLPSTRTGTGETSVKGGMRCILGTARHGTRLCGCWIRTVAAIDPWTVLILRWGRRGRGDEKDKVCPKTIWQRNQDGLSGYSDRLVF